MESETKTHSTSSVRACQNCKKDFIIEPEDFQFYEKIKVPTPTWCPECRLIRRLTWRDEKSLYKQKCAKCGKQIISVFPQDSGLVVYCRPCWWDGGWDGLDFGMEYDSSRPFLLQLRELLQKTPVMSLFGLYTTLENSEYTNMATDLKNCYLITHSDFSENCMYGSVLDFCKDSVDNFMLAKGELCYETINCRECYKVFFSVDCESCNSVFFSRNCIGCSDCIGCVNLRNKKYCIFNKEYSKEEYEKLAGNYVCDSYTKIQELIKKAQNFWEKFPQKFMHGSHNSNVSGDYVYNSKNVHNTFITTDMEDSRYCSFITPSKVTNCYDFTHYGHVADLVYESLQVGNQASRILSSWFAVTNVQNVEYSIFSIGSKNVFGTVSLKKREYCILNKQYSKEEFEKLRDKIIKDMSINVYKDKQGSTYFYGDFFPIEMSPFGYNATTAQEFFPLAKEVAHKKGYNWKEQEKYEYKVTMESENIPDLSGEVSDVLLNEVIECEHKGKCNEQCSGAFKLVSGELDFYNRMNLPIPRLCPNCRHHARLKYRNPFKLWHRKCMKSGCTNEFETSYAPDRPEIIYCETCYNQEVA